MKSQSIQRIQSRRDTCPLKQREGPLSPLGVVADGLSGGADSQNEVTQHKGCQDQGIKSDFLSSFRTDQSRLHLPQRHTCLLTLFRCRLSAPHNLCVGIDTSSEGLTGKSRNSLPSHSWMGQSQLQAETPSYFKFLRTKGHSQTTPPYPSKSATVCQP